MFSRNDDCNIHLERLALKGKHINLSQLKLQFYGLNCVVESAWDEVLQRLEKDFSAFKQVESLKKINLYLLISCQPKEYISLPSSKKWCSRSFVTTYYSKPILVNDYGDARSQLNLQTQSAHIASSDIHRAQEVAYLLILSRMGKQMELAGYHKIHAMAFAKSGHFFCVSMDSGGGKSTLLQSLLADDLDLEILSDDCPVVSHDGHIRSFPLRLGLSPLSPWFNHPNQYELHRKRYGVKRLLDIKHVPHALPGQKAQKYTLIFAHRSQSQTPKLESMSKMMGLIFLIKPFFIGVGLPIIFEYFWEPGFKDFLIKMKIAILRLKAGFALIKKAQVYRLEMNNDLETSKAMLRKIV